MRRLTTYTMLAFFLGAFIFGLNAFAGKSVDWPGYAGGSHLAVIEGTIKSIDLETGDYVKCNYSKRDGKYEAVRIIYTIPFLNISGG